jgi:histidine triad (HIT) family protein
MATSEPALSPEGRGARRVAGCVFCAIGDGKVEAFRIADEPRAFAFLDARPVFKGHVLVVTQDHVADLAELPEADLAPLFGLARRVANALEKGLGAQGAFVAVNHRISQSVPHLHVHVVPRSKGDGLRGFFWPRRAYASKEEAEEIAAKIRAALPDLIDPPATRP